MKRPLLFLLGVWILGECAAQIAGVCLHPPTQLDTRMRGRESAQVRVFGVVAELRPSAAGISYVLEDARAELEGKLCSTRKILVFSSGAEGLCIGHEVEVRGELGVFERVRNPGGFDYRAYYQALDIDYRLTEETRRITGGRVNRFLQALAGLRAALTEALYEITDEEEAAQLTAMLLGDRSGLSGELRRRYQEASLSHLLSISGLHISLLAMGLYRLLRRLGLPGMVRIPLAAVAAVSYCILCGGAVGAKRAGIMFLLYLGAQAVGRTYDSLSALGAAGLLLLMEHPLLLFQNGFLLSFLAVAGVSGLWPLFRDWSGIKSRLGVPLAVQWMTWPIVASMNGMIPILGIVFNLAALPAAGALLVSAAVSAVIRFAGLPGSRAVILPARAVLAWLRFLTGLSGELPGQGWMTGCPAAWQVALYYVLLVLLAVGMKRQILAAGKKGAAGRKGKKKAKKPRRRLLLLAAASLLLPFTLRTLPVRGLQVWLIDVGQGDAILIRDRTFAFLIDGGSSQKEEVGEEILLPCLRALGVRRLAGVAATHADTDHVSGLAALFSDNHLKIDALCLTAAEAADPTLASLRGAAETAGASVRVLEAGDSWTWGKAAFSCLYPTGEDCARFAADLNGTSMVLRLDYEGTSFLFTGDLGEEGEKLLLERGLALKADVLKVGHHGSRFSSSEPFLRAVAARTALISCGKNNRYGHPHGDTMNRLRETGSLVFTTAEGGALLAEAAAGEVQVIPYLGR